MHPCTWLIVPPSDLSLFFELPLFPLRGCLKIWDLMADPTAGGTHSGTLKAFDDARPSCQAHHRWHSQGLFADLGMKCECIVCKGQDYQSMNSGMRSCSEMFSIIGSRGLSYSTTISVPHSKKRLDKHTPWVGRKSWHFGSTKTLRLPEV